MTRRAWIAAGAAAAAGCARETEFRFPETAGAWTRAAAPAPADTPKAARRAWQAAYTGPFAVKVTVAEMLSGPNAFEAVQRWRSEPGKMPFYRDKYFGVAEAPGSAPGELSAFVQAFEEASAK